MADGNRHWWDFLQDPRSRVPAKTRWKILREGLPLDSILETTSEANSSWRILTERGDYSRGAIKCLLKSTTHNDECEMVVLFPKKGNRATVCVSSQIGCAVGCVFCSTGTMGLRRNLASAEILEQVYLARCIANRHARILRNVVFMGMGEPLHNCDALWKSLSGMVSDSGFGLAPRSITVSTAIGGRMLTETAERFPQVRFALSLHSANPNLRNHLVPKAPSAIERLKEVVRSINQIQSTEPVWLEVTLLEGINDRPEDIDSLIDFCHGLRVQINLIPYNPIGIPVNFDESSNPSVKQIGRDSDGKDLRKDLRTDLQGTELSNIYEIAQVLRGRGLTVRVRQSFGDQDLAACGQLALFPTKPN